MERPPNLPDFEAPPINEVVLGVQFGSIPGYSLIKAGEVWQLFRDQYPHVETRPAAPPQFETFGGSPGSQTFSFQFGNPVEHPRFWFVSEGQHGLLQFEDTRLLHNWRQIDGVVGIYPRFESLISDFRTELHKLQDYALKISTLPLSITQVELSYFNRLYADQGDAEEWPWSQIAFVTPPGEIPEGAAGTFQFALHDGDGPRARQYIEYSTMRESSGRAHLALSQTIRGAPKEPTIDAALDFLGDARQFIVESFARMTTEEAHKKWKRTQ